MTNLNYLIFSNVLLKKKKKTFTDNRNLIQICINIFENINTSEIKSCYILKHLRPEGMKLRGIREKA